MTTRSDLAGKRASLTVWIVVNALNVLKAVGFLSRVRTGSMAANHVLGIAIMAPAIPAAVAFTRSFVRERVNCT